MGQNPNRTASSKARRRRRSRLGPIIGFVIAAIGLAWFFELQATTTVIFVKHADTDGVLAGSDPSLNGLGRQRAELLADVLQDIDVVASVDAIYTSDSRRTQQTAAPLAERLHIDPSVADPKDVVNFMAQVLHDHKGRIVLVVTDADEIAPLVAELHGSKRVPPIASDEYDNIYIVSIPWFGKVKTLRLHYGLPWSGTHPLGVMGSQSSMR